jgi:hypothetical protein
MYWAAKHRREATWKTGTDVWVLKWIMKKCN